MSGTSLDGVDAAVAWLEGSGRDMDITLQSHVHVPYPEPLRDLLLRNSASATSSVYDLSQLNARLAHAYATAVQIACAQAGVQPTDLDLVGSHGQTVHHVPRPADCAGRLTASTLQIGDPATLACLLEVPVIGDFRTPDMALGGQGAPLVPYFDYVFFADDQETRGLLNLGGIANLTVLPAGGVLDDVYAFDTGPANMVIDALAQWLLNEPYDAGGQVAAQGRLDNALVAELLDEAYFAQQPPKSTGREAFGAAYVEHFVDRAAAHDVTASADLVANATGLTVASVYQAYARFVREQDRLDVLIVAGGGARNGFLMRRLAESFAPIPVRAADAYGLASDAKEALCFAVLAHEWVNGVPTSLPRVTGADRPARLGKLCLPPG